MKSYGNEFNMIVILTVIILVLVGCGQSLEPNEDSSDPMVRHQPWTILPKV